MGGSLFALDEEPDLTGLKTGQLRRAKRSTPWSARLVVFRFGDDRPEGLFVEREMKITAVILAAGQGTRMRSALPKVLHPLLGRPMVSYAVDTARQVTSSKPVLVIGHGREDVQAALGIARGLSFRAQLGTGHA
jgi:hypothetical protein